MPISFLFGSSRYQTKARAYYDFIPTSLTSLYFSIIRCLLARVLHFFFADMASLEIREPPTFSTLPPEIRNHIYTLSKCLQLGQTCCCCTKGWVFVYNSGHREFLNCTKCYDWNFPPLGTDRPTPLSLWVNRNSERAIYRGTEKDSLAELRTNNKRARKLRVNCDRRVQEMSAAIHAKHIDSTSQPALTMINKQIRQETLPMFYGIQSFLFTLFERASDSVSIFKWLRTIGKQNASFLRSIKIVYRKKKDRQYIQKTLMKSMNKLGVRTDAKEGVVMAIRLEYPFCYCEGCIRNLLGEG